MPLNLLRNLLRGPYHVALRLVMASCILLVLTIALNFWPRFFLRTPAMLEFASPHFVVWAEDTDRREAIWLRTMLEDRGVEVTSFLNLPWAERQKVHVFMYHDQASFQIRRGGIWVLFWQKAWYVVDHIGATILLTAPRNTGPFLERYRVLQAGLDEYIRSLLGPFAANTPLWLIEGTILRLGSGSIDDENLAEGVPSLDDLTTVSPADFRSGFGSRFADSFVAWIEMKFGRPAVLELLHDHGNYRQVLHRDLASLYVEWVAWLRNGKPGDPRAKKVSVDQDAP